VAFVEGPEAPVEVSVDLKHSMGFLDFGDWEGLSVLVGLENSSMANLVDWVGWRQTWVHQGWNFDLREDHWRRVQLV
jgi:hypothetical protein